MRHKDPILFLIFLFFVLLNYSQVISQESSNRISGNYKNEPLKNVLKDIESKLDITFSYLEQNVADINISVQFEDKQLTNALEIILQNTRLTFKIQESSKTVLLYRMNDSNRGGKKTINGYIEDANSGEKLIGANIYIDGTNIGTTSDKNGFYSFTIPVEIIQITLSYIGYETKKVNFDGTRDIRRDLKLKPLILESEAIAIEAEKYAPIELRTQMSAINIHPEQIKMAPAMMGETDVLKTIQMLPGVQSGNEGSSGLYVRGGDPAQNLILLDDVPVYNSSHLFGLISTFNADAIKNVEVIKGGFPARYSGRTSSVVDLTMKDGDLYNYNATGSLGLTSSKFTVEGPIQEGRTSFIASGRISYIDLYLNKILDIVNKKGFYFYDINAKLSRRISNNDRISLSYYNSNDNMNQENNTETELTTFSYKSQNEIASARWNHIVGKNLFSNVAAYYSTYNYLVGDAFKNFEDKSSGSVQYESGIQDIGLKLDFHYLPNTFHNIRFGLHYTNHAYKPGSIKITDKADSTSAVSTTFSPAKIITPHEFSVYVEDDFEISRQISANFGLNISAYQSGSDRYQAYEPRFSAKYLFSDNWSLKLSYSRMAQYVHLLSNSSTGVPSDLWVPATKMALPQKSDQFALGLATTIKALKAEFSTDVYYKNTQNLIEYAEGTNFLAREDWQEQIESGKGRSYGIEFFLQKKTGRTTGWISYTLSRAERTFKNLNRGETFPYKYDRLHNFSIYAAQRLWEKWQISASWIFQTGSKVTVPLGYWRIHIGGSFDEKFIIYDKRNSFSMPASHRLDLSIKYFMNSTDKGGVFDLSVYNVYNRQNPYYIEFRQKWINVKGGSYGDAKAISLFPIIVTLTYSYTF